MNRGLWAGLIVVMLLAACRRGDGPSAAALEEIPNSLDLIIGDMTLPHEGRPHGVPDSYSWAAGPRVGMGNDPGTFRAMIAWGQLYEDAEGNPATNTRVQIRDIRAYILRGDGQWHLLQSSQRVEGALYREDFAGDVNIPGEIRREDDGSISVIAGQGHNFHFWTPQRSPIDPDDIHGVFTTVQARLIVDDPALPDDRHTARYLMSMGADYWLSTTAQWDNWTTNGDIGIGRFRYVTPAWQWFNMTSLSEAELRQHPPPH